MSAVRSIEQYGGPQVVVIDHNPAGGFMVWIENVQPLRDEFRRRTETIKDAHSLARVVAAQRHLGVEDRTGKVTE